MSRSNHSVEPEELMAYLDGELLPEQALATAAHLEHCRECQTLAAGLKEISEMLVGWQVEAVGESLPDRITSELDHEIQRKPRLTLPGHWPRFRMPTGREVWWGSALVVILLLILLVSVPSFHRNRIPASSLSPYLSGAESQDGIRLKRQPTFSATPVPGKTVAIGKGTLGKLKADKAEDSNGLFHGLGDAVSGQPITDQQSKVFSNQVPSVAGRRFDRGSIVAQESAIDRAADLKNPMIIRTADLAVTVKEFEKAQTALDEILRRHQGHVGELNVNTPAGAARSLTGTLRVPSNRLDEALSDLKSLGRVERESQVGEEVTQQYVDLQARLANSKHTEERLTEILRQRTGKLSDVLAVEMQISRVRGEIEQMEAQRKTMENQVDFATLNLTLTEDYKKELSVAPPSTSTQIRNAAVDGFESLANTIVAVLLWLLSTGPALLLWGAILVFPLRMAWRMLKPRLGANK